MSKKTKPLSERCVSRQACYILTHASAREATISEILSPCIFQTISTHASAREATSSCGTQVTLMIFQLTPPHGRRPSTATMFGGKSNFNSRLRTGGDFFSVKFGGAHALDFNSRLRTGGDDIILVKKNGVVISTHASAREATLFPFSRRMAHRISTHASAREATGSVIISAFQLCISTHASAREATE